MNRSVVETVLGAAVLLIAGFFLMFGYHAANISKVSGYDVTASFSGIGGLGVGDDVRISGVKIGSVISVTLNPQNYLAQVRMSVDPGIELPDDTAAVISSESLLGGRYMELQPGASEDLIKAGGTIQYTQSPQNLEQLLGKFIFNMQSSDKGEASEDAGQGADAAGAVTTPAPAINTGSAPVAEPVEASHP